MELGINLKVNGVTFGPVVTVTVEMSGNDTGVELGVEVEVVAVRKKLLKRGSEASGFRLDGLAGFRNLFGGAVFAEERMSAELLHSVKRSVQSAERRCSRIFWCVQDRII